MKFNNLNKKRVSIVVACALAVSGVAVYAGMDGNSKKDNASSSLNAGVSLALNAKEIESIDVTAGISDVLWDSTNVAVTGTGVSRVAQGLSDAGENTVAENTQEVLTDE